jgi:hypothetical protein
LNTHPWIIFSFSRDSSIVFSASLQRSSNDTSTIEDNDGQTEGERKCDLAGSA